MESGETPFTEGAFAELEGGEFFEMGMGEPESEEGRTYSGDLPGIGEPYVLQGYSHVKAHSVAMEREELKAHLKANEARVENLVTEAKGEIKASREANETLRAKIQQDMAEDKADRDRLSGRFEAFEKRLEQQFENHEKSYEKALGSMERGQKWMRWSIGIAFTVLVLFMAALTYYTSQLGAP